MEIYKKHFGKKLKEALLSANKKQIDLANKLEVNASAVSQWISGKDFPDDTRLPDICKFLNISQEYFVRDQMDVMSAQDLINLIEGNKDTLSLVPKIPKDIIKMLAQQDDKYFSSLRRTLQSLEKKPSKSAKSTTAEP